MRTVPFVLFALGCNTFTTVDEACLPNGVPGAGAVERPTDVELLDRMNCHRRLAKRQRAPVNALVQEAVEGHRNWLEANAPDLGLFSQTPTSSPNYTGRTGRGRLDAVSYVIPDDGVLLEVVAFARGPAAAAVPTGGDYFDFWFEDPYFRAAWLQSTVYATGAAEADYTITYAEDVPFEDEPVHLMYWNVIYADPAVAYAEVPVAYPRNGSTDAPPDYTHLTGQDTLELGRTYGFPITFTVGAGESNLTLTQASLEGPSGQLEFIALAGTEASIFGSLGNSAIIVPVVPLQTGGTYTANVRIKTDQGERAAHTTFTVGGVSRDVSGLARQAAEDGIPAYELRAFRDRASFTGER